ncbi:MAG TPA: hypothetical protein VFE79_11800 [Paraburkholderia sp.]|nr:hypothetical protein [Paraburkholderia sp.]
MLNEPRKLVFTGLLVGAAAVAAYVTQSDQRWLSSDELSLERGGSAEVRTRGTMTSGAVSSGPVAGRGASDAAAAPNLQAARNSVLRNDLAAARAQLDAVHAALRNDQRALALQGEIEARGIPARGIPARSDLPQIDASPASAQNAALTDTKTTTKAAQISPAVSPVRGRHTGAGPHETPFAARDASRHLAAHTTTRRVPEPVTTSVAGVASAVARAPGTAASAAPTTPRLTESTIKVETKAAAAPTASPTVEAAPAVAQQATHNAQTELIAQGDHPAPTAQSQQSQPTPPMTQFASNSAPAFKTDSGGPKTRAEVRAEIVRARGDGSLPAFGNPNPAGPGGAPSLTIPTGP